MAYAIVETSGTQLRVEPGRFYDVNRLHVEEDETITLDKVLFVENEGEFTVGQPFVEGATVEATIQRHLRGRKIIVYKMQPKKKTRKKRGHRQDLTRVMITGINLNGTLLTESTAFKDQPSSAVPADEPEIDDTDAVLVDATEAEEPDVAPVEAEAEPETEAVEADVADSEADSEAEEDA
ncbi:MAG: 50S ribosomal protein L21 [Leptolyngbyaceae bacterium]|nr:50S ribosomal protein L21 [Leptolyngbyaceae bacterium]